jgi:hypothetical protein
MEALVKENLAFSIIKLEGLNDIRVVYLGKDIPFIAQVETLFLVGG